MYQTGTVREIDNTHDDNPTRFSDVNWNNALSDYTQDILMLDAAAWKEIEERTASFAKKRGNRPVASTPDTPLVPRRQREYIQDDV